MDELMSPVVSYFQTTFAYHQCYSNRANTADADKVPNFSRRRMQSRRILILEYLRSS